MSLRLFAQLVPGAVGLHNDGVFQLGHQVVPVGGDILLPQQVPLHHLLRGEALLALGLFGQLIDARDLFLVP